MNKKIEIQNLEIPQDDIECWALYPKHRWVYDLSRLLDAQNIKWSPYMMENLTPEKNLDIYSKQLFEINSGIIYTCKQKDQHVYTEIFMIKGEIKLMRHLDPVSNAIINDSLGELELRINAFTTLYFSKFTGIFSIESFSNEMYRIRLRPLDSTLKETNTEIIKFINRIYKKNSLLLSGLTDRTLQEVLTS